MVAFDAGGYFFISQGCLTVEGMVESEEMLLTNVCTSMCMVGNSLDVCTFFSLHV